MAQRVAAERGGKAFTSLTEALAAVPIDIVVVCTPTGRHGEVAIEVRGPDTVRAMLPPGRTRCAVSAVSLVLIAQMCRAWTEATPGRA